MGVATYTQKRVHIWTKNMGIFYHNSDGLVDGMCTKRVRRTNINLSKSNFDSICDDVGIASSYASFGDLSKGLIIYEFYNLL